MKQSIVTFVTVCVHGPCCPPVFLWFMGSSHQSALSFIHAASPHVFTFSLHSHRSRAVATPRTYTGGQKEDNLWWIFTHLLLQGAGGQVSRRLVHDPCPVWAVRVSSSTAGAGPASTLYSRADSCKWPVAAVAIHTSASTEQALVLPSLPLCAFMFL